MKKNLLKKLLSIILVAVGTTQSFGQCSNTNTLVAGNLTPPGVSLSTTQTYVGGQYVLASVEMGANYTISTCSSTAFDSQITVYDDVTGTLLAYNDDFCGLQSTVTFTPSSCNDVRVLLNQYFCTFNSSSMDVTMTMNSPGTGNPSLSPAPDQLACTGGTATIGLPSNGFGGVPPYAYSWNPITNVTTPLMSQTTVTNITATQNYDLTITDANGCRGHDTVLVTLLGAPTVFLGNDTTICGGPILLDAGNPGSTYLWSTGAGSQTLSPTTTGAYSVTVQTPMGCIGNDAINIVVNPLPTVSIGPDTTSCGTSVTLNAGTGYSSYTWSTGDLTQTTNVLVSDTVAVTITDANGCAATDSAIVTLSPAPIVNLGADVVQCGGTITLDAQNAGSLYFWSNSTSNQTTTVNSSGTYIVQVITPAGCSNSDSVNITINPQPVVNLGPDFSICTSSTTLNAGNAGSNFLWSTAATTQTINVGTGIYNVTVTNAFGCFDRDTVVVNTNATPFVNAGPDVSICTGNSTTLNATGGLTYVWSNGALTASNTVSPIINTTYYVTGYDINGCSASSTVAVTVVPLANAQFTSSVVGATAIFTNQSTNALSYSWNYGDASPLGTTANPSHAYSTNGTYTVTLTVTSPCGTDTYTMTVVITQVGIQDNDLAQTLSLYPNPNDGNFTIAFDFTTEKDVIVEVMDMSGRVIYTDSQKNILGYNKHIGLVDTESGMYIVRIMTTDGVVTEKVTIQR